MRRITLTFTCVLLVLVSASQTRGTVPTAISVQGRLTDGTGTPLPPGFKSFTFKIYDAEENGTEIWPGETQFLTTNVDGIWSASVGTDTPLAPEVFDESERWLQITVDDGTKTIVTLPRVCLITGPYAFAAANATRADTASVAISTTPDDDWILTDSVLYTALRRGILKGGAGNFHIGDSAQTVVNLGVSCTTGVAGGYMAYGMTVAGGRFNKARSDESTVGGGRDNDAANYWTTVAGGSGNLASGATATVGGGVGNKATGIAATIAGGTLNEATSQGGAVGGGRENDAFGQHSTISGGYNNSASGDSSAIGGGTNNIASGLESTVTGGRLNSATGDKSTVGGGVFNYASGPGAMIGGGESNNSSSDQSVIAGGISNIASGSRATVGGGLANSASAPYATVPGGRGNEAGGSYSFAGGRRAKALHDGAFVWADATNADFSSTTANIFAIRASGGVGIGTANPLQTLDVRGTIGNAGTVYHSDRRWKKDILPLSSSLHRVMQLKGVSYLWRQDEFPDMGFPERRTIGLIAQDVEEIIPEVVLTDSQGYKSVDYARLVAVLVEAVKELKHDNDELRALIEEHRADR